MIQVKNNEVHLWQIDMNNFVSQCDDLQEILTETEWAKANRFVQKTDRERSIIARSLLRQLLGKYLLCKPEEVNFQYNAFDKPMLADSHNNSLYFNVSHSQQWIVYAISPIYHVGVDIEYINPEVDVSGIAERFFHSDESRYIQSLNGDAQVRAFFHCWTRKEALLKALGEGLSFPLEECHVSLDDDEMVSVLKLADHDINDWKLFNLNLADGFAAAVAIHGPVTSLKQRMWSEL